MNYWKKKTWKRERRVGGREKVRGLMGFKLQPEEYRRKKKESHFHQFIIEANITACLP